jgi:hypothetical protein
MHTSSLGTRRRQRSNCSFRVSFGATVELESFSRALFISVLHLRCWAIFELCVIVLEAELKVDIIKKYR